MVRRMPEPLNPLRAPALSDNALVRLTCPLAVVAVLLALVVGLAGRSPDITTGNLSVVVVAGSGLARLTGLESVFPCAASFLGVCGSDALRFVEAAGDAFSPIDSA